MPKSSKTTLPKLGKLGGTSKPKQLPDTPPLDRPLARPETGFRRVTVAPRGPRYLGLGQVRKVKGGPGLPPPEFKSASTSTLEWYFYWGSFVVLPTGGADPRRPPFIGYPPLFDYQVPDDPLDVRAAATGVSDLVYHLGTGDLIVRVDSYYYHAATTPEQITRDRYLKLHGNAADVHTVSAWDYTILGDPTGRAACAAIARALNGQEPISPVVSGLAYPVADRIAKASGA